MADNVTADPGTGGATFKTDDDGTAHWPYTKLAFGADNTQTIVTSTATNPLPVALSDTDNAVLDSIQAAVEIIDDWDESDRAKVNLIVGQAGIAAGAGAVGVTVPRVTLASDDPAVALLGTIDTDTGSISTNAATIAGAVSGTEMQVDIVSGTVDLGATDNAVLDSIAANTNNLTNCIVQDDAPFTPATGYLMMIGGEFDDAGSDSVDEGDAGNVRISANRSMYVQLRDAAGNERGLNIDANGDLGATITGSVTVDLGANNDVTLATLPDTSGGDLAAINTAVSGTLTVGSHAVTNAGTFATQVDGAALTALQVIDNPVFADDAAFTLASSSVMVGGAIRDDSLTTLTAIEGDAVPLRVSSTGALHVTGGGGGTQYSVDDAGPTVVTMAGVVRDDSLTTLTEVDGDATLLRVNSTGALHVTGGGGGTEYTEDVATANPIVGTATMIERDDALATVTPIEGDWISLRGTAEGALWVQDFNSDAILSDTTSIDGKITACDTGAVVLSSGTVTTVSTVTNLSQLGGAAISMNTGVRDAGTQRVTIATDDSVPVTGTVTANLSATDNAVLDTIDAVLDTINAKLVSGTVIGDVNLGATDNAVLDSIVTNTTGLAGTVSRSELQVDVVASLPAGTNNIGDVDVATIAAGSNLIGDVSIQGRATGGLSIFRSLDLDETEEEVKGTAGTVYSVVAFNMTAGPFYLKLYNLTAASTTVGTSTPVITIPIPANADSDGAGFVFTIPQGIAFGTAITAAVTTGVADADTTGPGANEAIVNIFYK